MQNDLPALQGIALICLSSSCKTARLETSIAEPKPLGLDCKGSCVQNRCMRTSIFCLISPKEAKTTGLGYIGLDSKLGVCEQVVLFSFSNRAKGYGLDHMVLASKLRVCDQDVFV